LISTEVHFISDHLYKASTIAQMRAIEDFVQLLFPTRCFGCSAIGISICANCRSEWHPHLYKSKISGVTVYSSVMYSPVAKRIILAAKESGLQGADDLLIQAMIHSLNYLPIRKNETFLVPIPSTLKSQRRRGRKFIVDLSQKVSKISGLETVQLLEHQRKVRDQSHLNAKSRNKNMIGALTISRGKNTNSQLEIYGDADLILIDDVLTSGATLREGLRALLAGGFRVIGAITAAVAQPLR